MRAWINWDDATFCRLADEIEADKEKAFNENGGFLPVRTVFNQLKGTWFEAYN